MTRQSVNLTGMTNNARVNAASGLRQAQPDLLVHLAIDVRFGVYLHQSPEWRPLFELEGKDAEDAREVQGEFACHGA